MSTLPTRIEREAGRRLEAGEIVNIAAARERALSRMLMRYISTDARPPLSQRILFASQGNYAATERVASDVREQIKILIVLVLSPFSRAQLFL